MALAPSSHLYTPEEFLELEDSVAYELYDGELVERPVSLESSETALILGGRLQSFVMENGLGRVFGPDAGLQIFPSRPGRIPRADCSFVSSSRLGGVTRGTGFLRVAPDLVAEVVSPGNRANEIARKVNEYLAAGVHLVWVIYPEERQVFVFRPDATVTRLDGSATLSGEDIVPGLGVALAALFPVPIDNSDPG